MARKPEPARFAAGRKLISSALTANQYVTAPQIYPTFFEKRRHELPDIDCFGLF